MYLITGGTGLIGSHLLLELVRQGKPVKALRRSLSNVDRLNRTFSHYSTDSDDLLARIEWVDGDILDFESLTEALEEVDRVYHCAAMVTFTSSQKEEMIHNNVTGTINVVNACLEKGIDKLCFVSSTAAVGHRSGEAERDESLIWKYSKHRSSYSISKYRSEMEVWRGVAEGLNAVIVNPSIVIGPGDWSRSSARIFDAVWKGIKFYTHGITGYVDVWDVVHSMVKLMESKVSGERFLITSENLSFKEVFNMVSVSLLKKPPRFYAHPILTNLAWCLDWLISKLLFKDPSITKETARSAHNRAFFSNKKIKDFTSITFKPVKQSIEETAKFFLEEHRG